MSAESLQQSRSDDADVPRAVDVLKSSGADLKGVVAAKVDGVVVDLSRAVPDGAVVEPVAADSSDGLDVLRHSSAHLMAQAVQRLFPGTQVTIGPVIDSGFFYDFKRDTPFTPEDLEKIRRFAIDHAADTDQPMTCE